VIAWTQIVVPVRKVATATNGVLWHVTCKTDELDWMRPLLSSRLWFFGADKAINQATPFLATVFLRHMPIEKRFFY